MIPIHEATKRKDPVNDWVQYMNGTAFWPTATTRPITGFNTLTNQDLYQALHEINQWWPPRQMAADTRLRDRLGRFRRP